MANPGPASATTQYSVTPISNVSKQGIFALTISPASVAANTTAEQTFAATGIGLLVGDWVAVMKPTAQAGLGIVGVRVSAADTLAITFSNNTGSPIVPTASEVYSVKVERVMVVTTGQNPQLSW